MLWEDVIADRSGLYYVLHMFRAKVVDNFSAAHHLRGYQGDCERLHGHNYRVEVVVATLELDDMGIVMDFRDLKLSLKDVLKEMDHQYLNDLPIFTEVNPSAEHIAEYIYARMKAHVLAPVRILEVAVWENETCCAFYGEHA